jgi:hypothetical protein
VVCLFIFLALWLTNSHFGRFVLGSIFRKSLVALWWIHFCFLEVVAVSLFIYIFLFIF